MRLSTAVATASVLILLVFILYPVVADAGDRRWIVQDGETVGYLETSPYGSGKVIVRDRAGQAVRIIEPDALGNGDVIRDPNGDRVGRVEGVQDLETEGRQRRDWRDGPRKEWGSHADRWGG